MTTRTFFGSWVIAMALACGGCRELECPEIAFFAVSLRVESPSGQPLAPEEVVFRVDGGEEEVVRCEDAPFCEDGQISFGTRAGSYEILVRRGPIEASATAEVGHDECHVITEDVVVVLPQS